MRARHPRTLLTSASSIRRDRRHVKHECECCHLPRFRPTRYCRSLPLVDAT
ncbi:hypothetical protein NY08_2120 [Rhodococcus sp. B7740]|nr:hypothetical protein NY08_2120 [Rhodococcus sp. B7740]